MTVKTCKQIEDEIAIEDRKFPCIVNGNHEVIDVKPLDENDLDDLLLLERTAYKWRGTCKHCRGSIVAEYIEEYN